MSLSYRNSQCPKRNIVHRAGNADTSGSPAAVITVEAAKDYMRLQGFIDVDASGEVEFSDDDTLIEGLISTATELLEEKLGCTIQVRTREALLTNGAGMIQIPYGPVISITSITDDDSEAVDAECIKVAGDHLRTPIGSYLTIQYTAGYATVPPALITEIKRLVAYLYLNRGDDPEAKNFFYQIAGKYNRKSWLL